MKSFRESIQPAGWSLLEFIIYPLLMLIAAPIVIGRLGVHAYGLWMLVSSFSASWSLVNFGVASSITRFHAISLASNNALDHSELIRRGVAYSLVGGFFFGALLFFIAPFLAIRVFSRMGALSEVVYSLRVAACLLFLAQLEFAFKAALKGSERFNLAAVVEMINKTGLVLAIIGVALFDGEFAHLLVVLVFFALIGVLANAWCVLGIYGIKTCCPLINRPLVEEISFAGWNWTQSLGGTLFHQADRWLIGAILGAPALAAYSVCQQLAQQIHALPAAMFSYLLPVTSRISMNEKDIKKLHAGKYLIMNLGVVALLCFPVIFLAKPILTSWMGEEFAATYWTLLVWLSGAYGLLAINVVPHYFLLAFGQAKIVSLLNLLGGFAGFMMAVFLVSHDGLNAVASSKFVLGFVLIVGYSWMLDRHNVFFAR